jgi:hypothetical protein
MYLVKYLSYNDRATVVQRLYNDYQPRIGNMQSLHVIMRTLVTLLLYGLLVSMCSVGVRFYTRVFQNSCFV